MIMLKLRHPLFKVIASYLIIAMFFLSLPVQGWAMLVPADRESLRAADMAAVRTALESTAIRQRLMEYGLTAEETTQRIEKLSDEQIHQLAVNLDALQAGGDGISIVISLLIIALLVILILELTGHHVVMKR
jgi:hypothetical protein